MLTDEQEKSIKEQLLLQLKNFPEEKRDFIKEKILSMNKEQLENFLVENNLFYKKTEEKEESCIFCNISNKKISSFILYEDKENLAVLEINPLSKGHSLIIPKKHLEIEKIPQTTFSTAKNISSRIKKKYKPKEIKINITKIMNHSLIEIIPLYGNEKERKKATEEDLRKIQDELKIEKKQKEKNLMKQQNKSNLKKESKLPILKPRIP
ncbi:MAG: HIT domain-containing protein [Candidatus Pacearchaeota archaeon]